MIPHVMIHCHIAHRDPCRLSGIILKRAGRVIINAKKALQHADFTGYAAVLLTLTIDVQQSKKS